MQLLQNRFIRIGHVANLRNIPKVQFFPPAGQRRMRLTRQLAQLSDGFPAVFINQRTVCRQLFIPHIQRRHQGWVARDVLEQRVALVQRPDSALEGVKIRRSELGKLHIHEPAPFCRSVLDDLQILRRKKHAADMTEQFSDSLCLPRTDAHRLFFLLCPA